MAYYICYVSQIKYLQKFMRRAAGEILQSGHPGHVRGLDVAAYHNSSELLTSLELSKSRILDRHRALARGYRSQRCGEASNGQS